MGPASPSAPSGAICCQHILVCVGQGIKRANEVDISLSVENNLIFLLKVKPHLLKFRSQQVGTACRQSQSLVVPVGSQHAAHTLV